MLLDIYGLYVIVSFFVLSYRIFPSDVLYGSAKSYFECANHKYIKAQIILFYENASLLQT